MGHFRGTVKGNRGEASRLGTKGSGLHVTANGWDIGVEVLLWHNGEYDEVTVYITGGSNSWWKRRTVLNTNEHAMEVESILREANKGQIINEYI